MVVKYSTTKIIYKFDIIPNQNTTKILYHNKENSTQNTQSQIGTKILWKMNKIGDFILPNFTIYNKAKIKKYDNVIRNTTHMYSHANTHLHMNTHAHIEVAC